MDGSGSAPNPSLEITNGLGGVLSSEKGLEMMWRNALVVRNTFTI